ncbi:MAG: glycerophosphodiester phosphodiesterase family protein, partial [Chitinophagaceae bacterium]
AVIQKEAIAERTVIQSFDMRTLQAVHKKYPSIKTSLLMENTDKRTLDEQLKELGFLPTVYSPHYTVVTPALVKACHDKGMKIIPWTINTKDEIERIKALGVDGIITDYPDLF